MPWTVSGVGWGTRHHLTLRKSCWRKVREIRTGLTTPSDLSWREVGAPLDMVRAGEDVRRPQYKIDRTAPGSALPLPLCNNCQSEKKPAMKTGFFFVLFDSYSSYATCCCCQPIRWNTRTTGVSGGNLLGSSRSVSKAQSRFCGE